MTYHDFFLFTMLENKIRKIIQIHVKMCQIKNGLEINRQQQQRTYKNKEQGKILKIYLASEVFLVSS